MSAAIDPAELLARSRRLAVVGASATPGKAAHRVPADLQRRGWDVVPVNPHHDEVLGTATYAHLRDVPGPIDLVVVFRPAAEAEAVARAAVEAGAAGLWLQSGIRSEGARRVAADAGMPYVEDACTGVVASLHRMRAPAPGSGQDTSG